MKKAIIPYFVLCSAILCLPSPSLAAPTAPKCYWDLNRLQATCAPPFGDIIQDVNSSRYLCGLGQCVINPDGRFRCSSVIGGAAVIDSYNRAACVGGCQDADAFLCIFSNP